MKYKQIILKKDMNGKFRFDEFDLPYDRDDDGEYIWAGVTANIYSKSNSVVWKKKLLEIQKQDAQEQIEKMKQFIEKIDCFSKSL